MITRTVQATHTVFLTDAGEPLLFVASDADGVVWFEVGAAAATHRHAFCRALLRERQRCRGMRFYLAHELDRCTLKLARWLGVEITERPPCVVLL